MDAMEFFEQALKDAGYGGLLNPCRDCACQIQSLAQCPGVSDDCRPAFRGADNLMYLTQVEATQCTGQVHKKTGLG